MRAHEASLRGFLVFLGCPTLLVEDVLQDVFLAVLARPFEDRGPRATGAWLRRVGHHVLLKTLERERRHVPLPEPGPAEAAWAEYEGDDQGAGYLEALRQCLRRERGRAREVLALRYAHSLGRVAIGERLGLAESGVKTILARARGRLRACIERRLAAREEG